MNEWVFLDHGRASGAENMAIDEFILSGCEGKISTPVLRLYQFDPPAVTIGYHQELENILDTKALKESPVDVVRRITGGRALLHQGELTYSLAAPLDYVSLGTGRRETYLKISEVLSGALVGLGLDVSISDGHSFSPGSDFTSPCLGATSRDELNIDGRKLVASSQRRTGKAFIQHGSLLLTMDSVRIVDYLKGGWESLNSRTTCLSREIGYLPDVRALKNSIKSAFKERFDVDWIPLEFSEEQRMEISLGIKRKREEFTYLWQGEGEK
jgi:lipoate-protein ligase A